MIEQAQHLAPELIRLRRDVHAHPELGFRETRTAQLVVEMLREIGGMEITTGIAKTGVVADLGTGGPTIAIRADMDALPILEQTNAPYASTNAGVMHACGHDAHTAMLLGTALLLRERMAQENLSGRVRFLFQPSEEQSDEENKSGGLRMVEEGAMQGVDAIIALHVDSTLPVGKVALQSGWVTAAVDEFEAWLTAGGGHGAFPHETPDTIWMLAPVLTALHAITSRRIDPLLPAVVSVGQVHGGTASNILPSEVYLNGTLRSFDPQVREQLIREVEQAVSVARVFGGDYRLVISRGYPAGYNAEQPTAWLGQVATDLLGADALVAKSSSMGAEDFAYMCERVPGAMAMIGAQLADGVRRPHHAPNFDIDERVLPLGTAVLAETALRFLRGELA